MEILRDSLSWGHLSLLLLLLGLAMPPATGQTLSYEEAVLRAVDGFNQRSSEANLYRLLQLEQEPKGDGDPSTPKPVSFSVKETVCRRRVRRPPEQCDFKENGLVKLCLGTVTLDQANGYFDINCEELKGAKLGKLGGLLRRGAQKIGEKIEGIGRKIKDFFSNIAPRQEEES